MKKISFILMTVCVFAILCFSLCSCGCICECHFYVDGGNGEIVINDNLSSTTTEETLNFTCDRTGFTATFTAVPAEGYQVKNWIENGKAVDSHELVYTVQATEAPYKIDVGVVFEPIA